MLRLIAFLLTLPVVVQAQGVDLGAPFSSIDGGDLVLSDWEGQPILVVNTASQCGFTGQYAGLQELYDSYRDRGLVVVAVPSDDFNQELGSDAEVKEFCELQFGIDLPMTTITAVAGADAHPFYASVRADTGFVPVWNFNKVLIGADGQVAGTFGSDVRPQSPAMIAAIEAQLN